MSGTAIDTLNRQLRAGISDEKLAELVMALRDDDRLCIVHEDEQRANRKSSARLAWRLQKETVEKNYRR